MKKFDIKAAVAVLNKRALPASAHACAKYVRIALEGGGIDTTVHPVLAKLYGPYLTRWGFKTVTATGYTPVTGDVRVFQPYTGGNTAGHIDMYNGTQWVSDFKEKSFWPGRGYQDNNATYEIYRWNG
jgi:type VI secretion system secreted protein VgrG